MAILIIVGCVVILTVSIAVVVGKAIRGKVTARRIEALYQAAAAGDQDQIQQRVNRGLSIDIQDKQGNTALHFAYYRGQQEAIDTLVAFGADDNLRNNEGLSPGEMAEVAATEGLLGEGAQCLGSRGTWLDEERGWIIYNRLRQCKPRIYNPAVVRLVLRYQDRSKLLHLAIKLGIPGSERRLGDVLHAYGTKDMAVDYLNAGSAVLREAAERWARRNNYRIYRTGGRAPVIWGQF